jgi:hypothetical protein
MDKRKILPKPQESSPKEAEIKDTSDLKEWNPRKELLNKRFILETIVECLTNGDADGAKEAFLTYVRAINRRKLARDSKVSLSTIEHLLQHNNPTLETAFKLLSV